MHDIHIHQEKKKKPQCSTVSMSMTSQLENEPRTHLFVFVYTLTYIKLCMGSNKGMTQNRHGVYIERITGAWSPDYTDMKNMIVLIIKIQ